MRKRFMMIPSRPDAETPASNPGPGQVASGRHVLRDQDKLWSDFLALAALDVDSLEKSVQAICEGRFDVIPDVEHEEEESDRREVEIEQECLRILALYEPVASDLRRMATVLKVNRDWERIADLSLRVARRARKLARNSLGVSTPEELKTLARGVLSQVRSCYAALAARDSNAARSIVDGDKAVDLQYRALRKDFKASLAGHPDQLNVWLSLMNTARNLERIADHAAGIAQTIVYLQEGVIIRHTTPGRSPEA